jgi:hypothetical protein
MLVPAVTFTRLSGAPCYSEVPVQSKEIKLFLRICRKNGLSQNALTELPPIQCLRGTIFSNNSELFGFQS